MPDNYTTCLDLSFLSKVSIFHIIIEYLESSYLGLSRWSWSAVTYASDLFSFENKNQGDACLISWIILWIRITDFRIFNPNT